MKKSGFGKILLFFMFQLFLQFISENCLPFVGQHIMFTKLAQLDHFAHLDKCLSHRKRYDTRCASRNASSHHWPSAGNQLKQIACNGFTCKWGVISYCLSHTGSGQQCNSCRSEPGFFFQINGVRDEHTGPVILGNRQKGLLHRIITTQGVLLL